MVLRGMIMDQANIPFQNGCRCEQNHWSVHLSVCDLVLWAGVAVEEEMTCEETLERLRGACASGGRSVCERNWWRVCGCVCTRSIALCEEEVRLRENGVRTEPGGGTVAYVYDWKKNKNCRVNHGMFSAHGRYSTLLAGTRNASVPASYVGRPSRLQRPNLAQSCR